jgi:hypothetical protein
VFDVQVICTIIHHQIDIKCNKLYGQSNWTIHADKHGSFDINTMLLKKLDKKLMVNQVCEAKTLLNFLY